MVILFFIDTLTRTLNAKKTTTVNARHRPKRLLLPHGYLWGDSQTLNFKKNQKIMGGFCRKLASLFFKGDFIATLVRNLGRYRRLVSLTKLDTKATNSTCADLEDLQIILNRPGSTGAKRKSRKFRDRKISILRCRASHTSSPLPLAARSRYSRFIV